MTPQFSVVVPTYGRPAFLAEALASVLAQTLTDFECIVVDDAGAEPPDLPDDRRVRLVRRAENGGPAAARNTGIDAATGRYVAFLDDDDVWTAGRLALAAAAHERAPVAVCWQSTLGAADVRATGRVLEGRVGDVILDAIVPHLGATSVARDVVPRFDERYDTAEDVDWWLRVAQSLPVATTPEVGLLYRVHDGPRARTALSRRIAGAQMLLDEHRAWFHAHPHAMAFRLKRMGLTALRVDDRRLARRCFRQSLRLDPQPRTAWHALRALAPARGRGDG